MRSIFSIESLIKDWRWHRRNGLEIMQLLLEHIHLVCQQHFGALYADDPEFAEESSTHGRA